MVLRIILHELCKLCESNYKPSFQVLKDILPLTQTPTCLDCGIEELSCHTCDRIEDGRIGLLPHLNNALPAYISLLPKIRTLSLHRGQFQVN
jgi:hypothetical protein